MHSIETWIFENEESAYAYVDAALSEGAIILKAPYLDGGAWAVKEMRPYCG